MKIINICAVLLCVVVLALPAGAAVINFDSQLSGTVISGSGVYSDVVFTSGIYDIKISASVPGSVFSSPNCAIADYNANGFRDPYRADFLVGGIDYVSVVLGDFNVDEDPLYLRAYNSSNVLLDQDSFLLADYVSGGPSLSVFSPDISYVVFGSDGIYPNSVLFDDFTYNTNAVPEPATLLGFGLPMLMIGLGKLRGLRK